MNFSFKSCEDYFKFYKNDSLIKVSDNNPLLAINLKHAELILKDLKKKKLKQIHSQFLVYLCLLLVLIKNK